MSKTRFGRSLLILCIGAVALSYSGCARSPQAKRDKFLAAGKKQMDKKEYGRALLEFKNAAAATPNDAEPFYELGLAFLGTGDSRSGIAALLHAAKLDPKHQGAQLKLAELMSAAKGATPDFLGEAESRAEAVLAISPDNPDALSALALAEMRLGKVEDATKRLQDTLEKFPGDLNAARTMAVVKMEANDLPGAEEVLQKAAAQAPKAIEPQIALGRFYLLTRRPSDAEGAFRRAAEIDPKSGPTLIDLGRIQSALHHDDQAEKTFRQLSNLPNQDYRSMHAIYLFQRGQHEDALKEFERLAKDDPKDHAAALNLTRAYLATKRLPEAQKTMEAALKKNPKDRDMLIQRAKVYFATGRTKEAQQDLTEAIRLDPNSAVAHYLMARIHSMARQEAERRQELTEALKSNAAYLPARVDLAESLIASGGAKAALEFLDQAPARQKHWPALMAQRNWALLALDNQAEARKSIDEALATDKAAVFFLQDGYLRLKTKDLAGARVSFRKVLEAKPEDTRALDSLARTYLMEKKSATALATMQDYVSQHPKSPALQYLLGEWLLQASRRGDARVAFSAALQNSPEFLGAKLKLADIDVAEGKLDAARQRLIPIAATKDGKAPAELALGTMEERPGGDAQAAIAHYRKVLEAEPNNLMALNNLSYHLANDAKQFDEALKFAQQAKELAPKDPSVDDTIGWAYYNKGLYEDAVTHLKEAVTEQPSAVRKYHLAMAYFKAGDSKRAQAVLGEARTMNATLPEAAIAQRLLSSGPPN
jgi:tetratricopeptide (TPR) repeat protein